MEAATRIDKELTRCFAACAAEPFEKACHDENGAEKDGNDICYGLGVKNCPIAIETQCRGDLGADF